MTETHTREWKRLWKDDYLKWICGFANAAGGVLEIGRDDDGRAVGVTDAATLLTEIPNKVQTTMGILVDVELTTENDLDLVTVRVAPHTQPISFRGEYYYRSGTTNQKLSGPALSRFILEKMNISWDAVTTQRVSLADLDAGAATQRWRRRPGRQVKRSASWN
jgi:ATP-dependent DNA helicase RecG